MNMPKFSTDRLVSLLYDDIYLIALEEHSAVIASMCTCMHDERVCARDNKEEKLTFKHAILRK